MAKDSFQEKTEKATPRRRSEARQEGNVARSIEINSAVLLLIGTLTLYFLGDWIGDHIRWGMVSSFRESAYLDLSLENIKDLAVKSLLFIGQIIAPLLGVILLFGIATNISQVGLLFSIKPLQPKLSKINPVEGFKRLLSVRSVVELVKGILKITIVGYFAYSTIKGDLEKYYLLMDSQITTIITFVCQLTFRLVLKITVLLLILAILDYIYQKWDYEKNLRMSRQEIKDEHKQAEGDPLVKRKIRWIQRQFAINTMIRELPEADVVITNPVFIAVALKYNSSKMSAPKVVAKGARKMAERIKAIAIQHDVPIVENRELARALFKYVEIGMEIPTKFYQAVAEVLSYVYRMKNKRMF